jgi:hypothetical protein
MKGTRPKVRGRQVSRARWVSHDRRFRLGALIALAVAGVIAVVAIAVKPSHDRASGEGNSTGGPIDRTQQTALSFGDRSHWLQPWRGYLDTVPATKLRDAIGINIDNAVAAGEVPALARLLAANGFRRARYEIGWGSIDYGNPAKLTDPASVSRVLKALKQHGIRPLILLNSNHVLPCPTRVFKVRVVAAARRGDRRIRIDRATMRAVVPGRSGLNAPDGKAADVLFKDVKPDGTATLSKPLPRDLAPGSHPGATLRYAPFGPPQRSDGSSNPVFERTLRGWLSYIGAVTHEARKVLGSDDFDVEIWNELGFGSDFLYADRYYDPPAQQGKGDVTRAVLDRTVAWLRDRAHGVSRVGIGNGFASQRPWDAGSTSPRGLTAIDKHPYINMRRFPKDSANDAPGIRPLDALGHTDGTRDSASNRWRDNFVPTYDAFFPEYYLTGIQTENLVRDLSPITTEINGTPHGRLTKPKGGRAPTMWVTEWNMDPSGADPSNPANVGGPPLAHLTNGDVRHMQAKAVLRFLCAWVNKGVSAVDFFAAKAQNLALVDPVFFTALKRGRYPGDRSGGETLGAVRRLVGSLRGSVPISHTRPLSLLEVSDDHHHKQFEGDSTAPHPPLFDRDVVGFFPYQVNANRYVIPAYVMTRSLTKLYAPDAPKSDRGRFDLPPEPFRLTIGRVPATDSKVTASDPLTGKSVPVEVISRQDDRLVVEVPLTDSPRLLTLDVH